MTSPSATPKPKIAAVVPALDEAATIAAVVRALKSAPSVSEVIVVDDGSTDRTAAVARAAGADQVISLGARSGKGNALRQGIASTDASVLLFCDADFLGFGPEHAESLIAPVVSGQAMMCVGLRDRGPFIVAFERLLPWIGGERALRREVFESVPPELLSGFRVELALNASCRAKALPVAAVVSWGVSQRRKIQKRGLLRGLWDYFGMLWEMAHVLVVLRLRRDELRGTDYSKTLS